MHREKLLSMDLKKQAAAAARSFIRPGTSVGLGDGQAVRWLAGFLAEDIQRGFNITLCTSSERTGQFLRDAGVSTRELLPAPGTLDQYFDGCDQIDSGLNVIKSGAGIHTMEKLYASLSGEFIILADSSKWVDRLGTEFPIAVEILPQAKDFVAEAISRMFPGTGLQLRTADDGDQTLTTVNGNYLLDCRFRELPEPGLLCAQCKQITGVIELSLFYQMVNTAIIAGPGETIICQRKNDRVSRYSFSGQ